MTVDVSVADGWESVTQSVGGRDLLVVDGQPVTPVPDVDGAHARTAVGIRTDGSVFFLTATNSDLTNGLKLPDLAEVMISQGAVDALNLDGGGSTQMAVRQPGDFEVSLLTPPESEAVYRPVSNALQVVSTVPTGPLVNLVVAPDGRRWPRTRPSPLSPRDRTRRSTALLRRVHSNGASRLPPAVYPSGPSSQPTPTSATFLIEEVGDHAGHTKVWRHVGDRPGDGRSRHYALRPYPTSQPPGAFGIGWIGQCLAGYRLERPSTTSHVAGVEVRAGSAAKRGRP